MSESQPSTWSPSHLRMRPDVYSRPKALLLADLALLGLFLMLGRWLIGGLLSAEFLTDNSNVPPFVANARLDTVHALLAFGLPMVVVAVTAYRLRFTGRATWPWTPLIVAWIVVAFAETVIATADFTATAFVLGSIPAALIGTHQRYLRRAAGQSPKPLPWTRRRRVLIVVAGAAIAIWVFAYLVIGVASISDFFRPLSPGFFPFPR